MSVVCAKVYNDKIVMAADSIIVRGDSKDTSGDFVKLTKINNMIVGGSGTVAEQSLMWQYMRTHKPASATVSDILEFMIEFSRWKKDLTNDSSVHNSYLLAYDCKLFSIQGMYPYEISAFTSIGAGRDFSNAAMHLGHSPREAVKVACDLSCYVAEPILEEIMMK
jgi:ATP-dependent protease HslVU (ClpYQ) peptidase subunit